MKMELMSICYLDTEVGEKQCLEMFFNESISKFLSNMPENDLLVLFSDTPPMFHEKRRVHFEDLIDVYFFSKK